MKEIRNVRSLPPRAAPGEDLDALSAFALAPAEVPADFVANVMRGLRAESGLRTGAERPRFGSWKWAAALLIFSAALGYGFSIAEETADSVASLTSAPTEPDSGILSSL